MKRKFKTNILIRDNRLEMMKNQGLDVNYKILSNDEYIEELKNKIVEEANEVFCCKDCHELLEEVADVLEVIEHIVKHSGFTMEHVNEIKKTKQEKIGGFDRKIKTFYVEADESNDIIQYYISKPDKYPEIKD